MPTLGLTLGDPCGIGPELWVQILCAESAAASSLAAPPEPGPALRLYGDAGVLARAAQQLHLSDAWQHLVSSGTVQVISVTNLTAAQSLPGQPTSASGAAQVAYLDAVIADAARGQVQGLVTGPIHKASAKAAGLSFPGHTELLADRLPGDGQVVMMLAGPRLRVALCTTHLALSAVPAALTTFGITQVLRTTVLALHQDFGVPAPVVWVAGLNPHAGEAGHFGDEETRLIAPAIAAALALPELQALPGLQLTGPHVPDAVFRSAVFPPASPSSAGPAGTGGRPDAVVAMYHDQGLIPLKLLDFEQAVNVTLGLRLPRTSPDHGVAHDIAGKGQARPHSQQAALALCRQLVKRRAGR